MKLTPEQEQALTEAREQWQNDGEPIGEIPERAFLAGLRMGRAEGREQAAKACDEFGAHGAAAIIRELPEEPT